MNSSDQNKNTQVSETAPVTSNEESRQPARPTSAVAQALFGAITAFYAKPWRGSWHCAYHCYWFSCRGKNLAHVSPRTFFQYLQIYCPPAMEKPRPSPIRDALLLYDMTYEFQIKGGASS